VEATATDVDNKLAVVSQVQRCQAVQQLVHAELTWSR